MKTVKQVAVFAENKPGQAARITRILAAASLNIRCITVASSGAYGVMKLLVNEPDRAAETLRKEGIAATLMEVLAVEMPDKPGALFQIADCLGRSGVNVDNTTGFIINNRAIVVLEVHNVTEAGAVLQKAGFHVLNQDETLAI